MMSDRTDKQSQLMIRPAKIRFHRLLLSYLVVRFANKCTERISLHDSITASARLFDIGLLGISKKIISWEMSIFHFVLHGIEGGNIWASWLMLLEQTGSDKLLRMDDVKSDSGG